MDQNPIHAEGDSFYSLSPFQLLLFISLMIFVCEGILMVVLFFLPPFPAWFVAIVDSVSLVAIVFPGLYFFLFRPLVQQIVERKRMEEALKESHAKLDAVFCSVHIGIIVIDSESHRIIDANPYAVSRIGASVNDIADKKCHEFLCPAEKGMCSVTDIEQTVDNSECFLINIDGEKIPIIKNVTSLNMGDKRCFIESFVDISELKKAQEEKKKLKFHLQQAQKMEAVATLAGGIAHEFNNALFAITGNIDLIEMDLPDNENIMGCTETVKSSAQRMANLTNQLLAYAKGGKYQPKKISLNNFVEETLPIIKHSIGPDIQVDTDLSRELYNINADFVQIQMVLSAILTNASEAISGEGRIQITTRDEEIDEDFAKHYYNLSSGRYISLTIEDNGKGMDEETRSRIFEPFFTTKFQGRGLGMAAVFGIIINHDGWVSVYSELGRGTVVRIYLPAVEAEEIKATAPKSEVATDTGTILLVEDEEMVMNVSRAMLERLGYRVLEAKTGNEAINMVKNLDGHIDLALLDIKLPDMEGDKVYSFIKETKPNLKVIVNSGYSIDGPAQKILNAGAQGFIQKPFSLKALSEKLKEVM